MPIIEDKIHSLLTTLIPEHLRSQGGAFVTFMEEYFKWLETDGQVMFHSRDLLENRDIDTTLDSFLIRFKEKYLVGFDFETVINKRMLIKHAQDLYRTKGTERGIELFFKLVYGEQPEIYYPAADLMRLSDSDYQRVQYLELEYSPKIFSLEQQTITGYTSGAQAFCAQIVKRRSGGRYIYIATIQDVRGEFTDGENITTDGIIEDSPVLKGSLSELTVIDGQQNFTLGETLAIEGQGRGGYATVAKVATRAGAIDATLIDGGYGFTIFPDQKIADKVVLYSNLDVTANTLFKGFELHETIVQPLSQIVFSRSNTSISAGDVLTNYHANGDVKASGTVVLKTSNNAANTSTVIVSLSEGAWASISSNVYTQSNTFSYTATSVAYVNATANAVTLDTSYIGLDSITGTFYANAIIVGSFSQAEAKIDEVYNNRKLTSLSFDTGSVGAAANLETVTINTDLVRNFLDYDLANVEFSNFAVSSNVSSTIASALSYEDVQVGRIQALTDKVTGNDYNFSTTVNLDEFGIRGLQKKDYVLKIDNATGILNTGEYVLQNVEVNVPSMTYGLANTLEAYIPNETIYQTNVYQINQLSVVAQGNGYQINDQIVFTGGGANSTTEPATVATGYVDNVGLSVTTSKLLAAGETTLVEDDLLVIAGSLATANLVTLDTGGDGYSINAIATVTNDNGAEITAAVVNVYSGPTINLQSMPVSLAPWNDTNSTFEIFGTPERDLVFNITDRGTRVTFDTLIDITPSESFTERGAKFLALTGAEVKYTRWRTVGDDPSYERTTIVSAPSFDDSRKPQFIRLSQYIASNAGGTYGTYFRPYTTSGNTSLSSGLVYDVNYAANSLYVRPADASGAMPWNSYSAVGPLAGDFFWVTNPANTDPSNEILLTSAITVNGYAAANGLDLTTKDGWLVEANSTALIPGIIIDVIDAESRKDYNGDYYYTKPGDITIATGNSVSGSNATITVSIRESGNNLSAGNGELQFVYTPRTNTASLSSPVYAESIVAAYDFYTNVSLSNTNHINTGARFVHPYTFPLGKGFTNGAVIEISPTKGGAANTVLNVKTGVYVPLPLLYSPLDREYGEDGAVPTGTKLLFAIGAWGYRSTGIKSSTTVETWTPMFMAEVVDSDHYGIVIDNAMWVKSAIQGEDLWDIHTYEDLYDANGVSTGVTTDAAAAVGGYYTANQVHPTTGYGGTVFTWANGAYVNTVTVAASPTGRYLDTATLKKAVANCSGWWGYNGNRNQSDGKDSVPVFGGLITNTYYSSATDSLVNRGSVISYIAPRAKRPGEVNEFFDNMPVDVWDDILLLKLKDAYGIANGGFGTATDAKLLATNTSYIVESSDLAKMVANNFNTTMGVNFGLFTDVTSMGREIQTNIFGSLYNRGMFFYPFDYSTNNATFYGGFIRSSTNATSNGVSSIFPMDQDYGVLEVINWRDTLANPNNTIANNQPYRLLFNDSNYVTVTNVTANVEDITVFKLPNAYGIVDGGGVVASGNIVHANTDTSYFYSVDATTEFYGGNTFVDVELAALSNSLPGLPFRVTNSSNGSWTSVVFTPRKVGPIYAADVYSEGEYNGTTSFTVTASDATVTGESGATFTVIPRNVGGQDAEAVVYQEIPVSSNATHYTSIIELKSNTAALGSTLLSNDYSFSIANISANAIRSVTLSYPGEDYYNTDADLVLTVNSVAGTGANITANVHASNGAFARIYNLVQSQNEGAVEFNSDTDIDDTNDVFNINDEVSANVGDRLIYSIPVSGNVITGLTADQLYYVVFANATSFAVSATEGGANIDITAPGANETHTWTKSLTHIYSVDYDLATTTPFRVDSNKPIVGQRNSYDATLTSLANTSENVTVKGVVTFANSSYAFVNRRTINYEYQVGGTITGLESGYTANVAEITYSWDLPVAGNNALVNTDLITTSGILSNVSVLASGIAYRNNETVVLRSLANNLVYATARTNNIKQGTNLGQFKDTRSFLSSDKYILDSYYYQEYSYDIKSPIPVDKYGKTLEEVVHAAGTKYFGSVVRSSEETLGIATGNVTIAEVEVDLNDSVGSANSGTFYVYTYSDTSIGANTVAMFGESDYSNAEFSVTLTGVSSNVAYFEVATPKDWKDLDRTQTWYLRGSNTVYEIAADADANVRFK